MEDFVLAEIIVNAVPVSMVTNARKVRMIILLSLRLCTIYKKFPENPVGKYCSGRFGAKFSRVTERPVFPVGIGTLRSNDEDGDENVTKTIGFMTKTITLYVYHAGLYISLPVFARLRRENASFRVLWST